MMSVEYLIEKIRRLELEIQKIGKPNANQELFIEQKRRLKQAYAVELEKAVERRRNGKDKEINIEVLEEISQAIPKRTGYSRWM